ncbi:uncharacterized protein LOC144082895 isoform X3 [Stigmatopora argus]
MVKHEIGGRGKRNIPSVISSSARSWCWCTLLSQVTEHKEGAVSGQVLKMSIEDQHTEWICGSNNITTSLNSPTEDQLGSCETFQRSSPENDRCSVSSGEMVLRSNSFCLVDQSLLTVSSLDESSSSPSAACASRPNVSNILTAPILPDVCEKNTENLGNSCLGRTIILSDNSELPTEEDHLRMTTSPITMPSENQRCLQATILCEESPAGKLLACVDSEPLVHFSNTFTPEKCIAFEPALSTIQDIVRVSTPIVNIKNNMLPHLESSCTENVCSPIFFSGKKTTSTLSKHCVVGQSPSAKKKKMEVNCSKSDLTNKISKVMTRASNDKIDSVSSPKHHGVQTNILTKCTKSARGATVFTPTKVWDSNVFLSVTTKKENSAYRHVTPRAMPLGVTIKNSSKNTMGIETSNSSIVTEQTASFQADGSPALGAGNKTFCSPFPEIPTDKCSRIDPKPTPQKNAANKIEVRSLSALRQGMRQSQSSTKCLQSSSWPQKDKKTIPTFSTAVNIPRPGKQTKPEPVNNSFQSKLILQSEDARELTNINLVVESDKVGTGILENSRSRQQTSPNQPRGRFLSQTPVSRTDTQPIRQRPGNNLGVDNRVSKGVETPPSKQRGFAAGRQQNQATNLKQQQNLSQSPFAPSTGSRLPRKTPVTTRSGNRGRIHSEKDEVGAGVLKQTPIKTVLVKGKLTSTPGRRPGSIVRTTNTSTKTNKEASPLIPFKRTPSSRPTPPTPIKAGASPLIPFKRTPSSRLTYLTPIKQVEKNKPKTSTWPPASSSRSTQNHGPPDVVPPSTPRDDRNDQRLQNLGKLLAASNCRFEAIAIVLQQTLAKRDEEEGKGRELSKELVKLREELVSAVNSSQRLEKEKQDLQDALDSAMQRMKEQHQKDNEEMEQKLQLFYQSEFDKLHLSHQEEADESKAVLEKQIDQLKVSHDFIKLELEKSHVEQMQRVQHQHEQSVEELRKSLTQQLESSSASFKDAEAALNAQIHTLTQENAQLMEKLRGEENKHRDLPENQDSHTVFLEQELKSLKVVLDIKNKQVQEQKKMMIEIDGLIEKNGKLDESLKKVQQENEDLKARMEKNSALSRQLSSEHAMLQESLQKQSNVNKHLSMEIEELLWKLHNGETGSPQKLSPASSSPSHSFSFQPSCSSDACSVSPLPPQITTAPCLQEANKSKSSVT